MQDKDIKTRLLLVGLELFSQRGFDGVSIRELATKAQANSSMITYHFGSKKGLYLAVYQYISDLLNERIIFVFNQYKHQIEELPYLPKKERNRRILDILKTLSDRYIDLMLDDASISIAKLLLSGLDEESEGFAILYENYIYPALTQLTHLIAILIEEDETGIRVKTLAVHFIAQHAIWRIIHPLGKAFVLNHNGSLMGECKEDIQSHIFAQLRAEVKED